MNIKEQFSQIWVKKISIIILPIMILLLISASILIFYGISKRGSAANLKEGTYDKTSILVEFNNAAFNNEAKPPTEKVEINSVQPLPSGVVVTFFRSIVNTFVNTNVTLNENATQFNDNVYRLLSDYSINVEPIFNRQGAINTNNLALFTQLDMGYMFKVNLREEQTVENALSIFQNSEYVVSAEANLIPKFSLYPNDPKYLEDQKSILDDLETELAWDKYFDATSNTNQDVKVAIIDGGFELEHEELIDNYSINTGEIANNNIDDDQNGYVDDILGWDFQDNDNNPSPNTPSDHHGTSMAGVISATTNNSKAIASIAWNSAKIIPLKINLSIAEAIQYATDNNAGVINVSLGYVLNASGIMETAINYARENDVILVAAAGNEGNETPYIPAAFNGIISVGGVSYDLKLDFNSSYGSWVNVFAPYEINTIHPEFDYPLSGGTSISTALVSSLAALIKSNHQDWSANRIAGRITNYTTNIFYKQHPSYYKIAMYKMGLGLINSNKSIQNNDIKKYPSGTLISLEDHPNSIAIVKGGYRKYFAYKSFIKRKYYNNEIVSVDSKTWYSYNADLGLLPWPNGTLLKNQGEDTIYVIENNYKRPFVNLDTFNALGYKDYNIIEVNPVFKWLKEFYSTGPDVFLSSKYPSGTLLGNNTSGQYDKIYLIDNGSKRKISKELLDYQYHISDIIYVNSDTLAEYPTISDAKYRDGTILKCSGDNCDGADAYMIYIVEFGDKRPILPSIFSQYGYKSENIIKVSKFDLDKYYNAPPIGIEIDSL